MEVLHTMCSGRISPGFIFQALEAGADGVLLTGCASDECHYDFGARHASHTYGTVSELLTMVGAGPDRVRYQQIPEGDAARFREVVAEFVGDIQKQESEKEAPATEAIQ